MEEQIEAVQRMQDYIDAHIYETITLADLASVSLYSPWYSYRLFVHILIVWLMLFVLKEEVHVVIGRNGKDVHLDVA